MLPSMSQLMPPLPFNDFGLVNLIDGPQMRVCFVEEDTLEDVVFVGDRGFVWGGVPAVDGVLAELVLVVCAIKGHFDLVHVFFVAVGVVHGSVTTGLVLGAQFFVFGECDLIFLLLGLWSGTQFIRVMRFEILFEVFAVGVGDCDIVEELCAAEDEAFFPVGRLAEEFFGIVGENAHDEFVVGFGGRGGVFVLHAKAIAATLLVFGIEGSSLEADAGLRIALEDGGDVGIGADGDTFRFEVCPPVGVKG